VRLQGADHIFWSALVEIIHTASLIHDDIVDNSTLRRGRDTVHAKWGPNISVLLGDFLYIQSIALALKTKTYPIIDLLADVTSRMVEGELIEFSVNGRPDQRGRLPRDHRQEDGRPLRRVLPDRRPAGGISPLLGDRLEEFGTALGLSFQIIDDLLDFKGEEKTLGKPVLSDFREGRFTLPLLHALRTAGAKDRTRLLDLIAHRKSRADAPQQVQKFVRAAGSLDYALERAGGFTRKAKDILAESPFRAPDLPRTDRGPGPPEKRLTCSRSKSKSRFPT